MNDNNNNNQFNINPQTQMLNSLNQIADPIQNSKTQNNQNFENSDSLFQANNQEPNLNNQPILPNPLANNGLANMMESNQMDNNQQVNNPTEPITNINPNLEPIKLNNFGNIETNQSVSEPSNQGFINHNQDEINMTSTNRFIDSNSFNETRINDLNIEGGYTETPNIDYSQEPQVRENLEKIKKNTITVTPEIKTVFIIALVLLIFIFVMPYLFDLLRNIKY